MLFSEASILFAYNTEMLILFAACYGGSRVNISEHILLLFEAQVFYWI